MTHQERILKAARGEMPDRLPYIPRIDLWYSANSRAGTLPGQHRGRTAYEISRAEGWGLMTASIDFTYQFLPEALLHRAIGAYALKEHVFKFVFSPRIGVRVKEEGERTFIEYHTPKGMVSTCKVYNEEMKRGGVSIPWVEGHIIRKPGDYRVVACLFENLDIIPQYDAFLKWEKEVGEDGLCAAWFAGAASPMHHIQKYFLDATEFFFHYRDYQKEMRTLAEAMTPLYEKALKLIAESPARAVNWGGNYDEIITYPPYFEKELLPWIQKASATMGAGGKFVFCHCDGENQGLLDLIRDSGMHVAESVCPYPMTKVKIEEYYRRWSDRLTIFGGVPSNILLPSSATDEEFQAFLDHLFKAIAPGKRFILGVADTTPRDADFSRLKRIGEMVRARGRLPLEGGADRPLTASAIRQAAARVAPRAAGDELFQTIREDVLNGDEKEIQGHILELIKKGVDGKSILEKGLIAAMEIIGPRFKAGEVFIPEVLLASRAMNEGLKVLEPHLSGDQRKKAGKIVLGTVKGDLHDIGKNLVAMMLRGIGFEVVDLGINVPVEEFVKQVAEQKPDILGLSALLTTTMPEMKRVIQSLEKGGLRKNVKVMIGGAPVNQRFAQEIGADGYGHDAAVAVDLAKGFMKNRIAQSA
jgi:corrinoid protein of di/trimethylamine methyltransferase